MSGSGIDAYLDRLGEPQRTTLSRLRSQIATIIPEAEEGLSYGVPAFRIDGKPIAGFSAAKHHVSYLPHSGEILATLTDDELAGLEASKGALKVPVDGAVPDALLRSLIERRRTEAGV